MGKVMVIGAGPGGSVAAVMLARAGVDVTVVEQHRFPRDKVCGECLSALALETMERIGVAGAVRKLRPAVLREAAVYTVSGRRVELKLPGEMWGVSRGALDEVLLKQAMEAGAKVLQPGRCEGIGVKGRGVRVRDLGTNEVRVMECEWVVVADGKSVMSESPGRTTGDFGIKGHFENVEGPRDVIELFGVRGAYGGLAAIEGGKWNAAFSVPGKWLKECEGNIEEVFGRVRRENAALDQRLRGARRVGEWLAAPLPRYGVRRRWAQGVVPVGNAAGAIEPIGGEGMGLAMASGEMAANFILEQERVGSGAGDLNGLFSRYERLWRVRSVSCRLAGMVVSRPWAARVLLPILNVTPMVGGLSLSLMGKGKGRGRIPMTKFE